MHKVDAFEVKRDGTLEIAFNDYLSPDEVDPKRHPWKMKTSIKDDYLASATKFARKVQILGYGSKEGADENAYVPLLIFLLIYSRYEPLMT